MKKLLYSFSLICCSLWLQAIDYHVGPSQTYTNISDVPWNALVAGDNVFIHYRATPYKEKIVLRGEGTAAHPISLIGVADANGNRPILDGDGAVSTAANYFSTGEHSLNLRSLIAISRGADDIYHYKPRHIVIDGLELQNVHPDFSYEEDGQSLAYLDAAAAVYVHAADNVTIRNCIIHHCANAIFTNSTHEESQLSRDILIESNHFYQNGVIDNHKRHTTYVQAVNATYQYNYYENMVEGALGNPIKDRSSGTVIRYNWIVANAHALDLVEAQEGASLTVIEAAYRKTYVYGNIIYNGSQGSTRLIHYGGDTFDYATYRRGTLYFYHNTVINHSDVSERYRVILFSLPSGHETIDQSTGMDHPIEEKVEAYNNIIYNEPATPGQNPSMFFFYNTEEAATIIAGKNWVSSTVIQHETPYGSSYVGNVEGWPNVTIGDANNDPGFMDITALDLRLRPDAIVIDFGQELPTAIQELHPVTKAYKPHADYEMRIQNGSAPDLGPVEYSPISATANIKLAQALVFPNPSSEVLSISNPFGKNVLLQLFDSQGRLLHQQLLSQAQKSFHWKNLPKGVYVLRFYSKMGAYSEQIIRL